LESMTPDIAKTKPLTAFPPDLMSVISVTYGTKPTIV
jgi:hypothetical protein